MQELKLCSLGARNTRQGTCIGICACLGISICSCISFNSKVFLRSMSIGSVCNELPFAAPQRIGQSWLALLSF